MRRKGLLVDPSRGQETLQILDDLELFDHQFKVRRTSEGKLRIPLTRQPSPLEHELIETKIGHEVEIVDAEHEAHSSKPESLEEALSLLPPGVRASVPKAFDIIGDLAVLELTADTLPYQGLIAQALMTVHKNVKGVYSKAGPVEGEDRVRQLRHLAGEARTNTIHREFGCSLMVDLAKAFYSPRLSNEHKRVADLVQPGEHVVDMFAGVGPFTIMIAKRLENVLVEAIDSNREAIRLLEENTRMNRLKGQVRVWNKDAREAVTSPDINGTTTRVIMNHPSAARVFVESACQALKPEGGIVHYYTFADGVEAEAYAVSELEENLEAVDWNIEETMLTRRVRATGPMSWQIVIDARIGPG